MTPVLFIAYEFPPLGGAGIRRSLILSRHLPEHGIQPVILTTDSASYQRDKPDLVDAKLLERIPVGAVIERIPTRAPAPRLPGKLGYWSQSFFTLTDNVAARWQKELEQRLPALVERYRPRAVYATLPPFSMASLACSVGKRTGLPVLLDFRDSWSQCGVTPYMSRGHYRALLRVERECLRQAAAVVCVTVQTKRDMMAAQPTVDPGKFRVIPNGFDAEFPDRVQTGSPDDTKPFVLGHVGSFYYSPAARQAMLEPWWRRRVTRWTHYSPRKEDWLYRSPYFFFRALARLFEEKPALRKRIRVRFVGAHPQWLHDQVREFNLGEVVEFLGYLGHRECLAFQSACDGLLITSAKVLGGEDYSISSKTFEYVTTGRPILAVVAPGAQRDFLARSGTALMCDPDDVGATAGQIERLVSGRATFRVDADFLAGYRGSTISGAIARALQEIAAKPGQGGD